MAELGHVDGEVDAALRAPEAGEAVGHVEDGLAARAGELGVEARGRSWSRSLSPARPTPVESTEVVRVLCS